MKITPSEVAAIARLARLDLPEDKVELFTRQLGDVLEYMDKLGELDTSRTAPMYSPSQHAMRLREDTPAREQSREEILANAPEDDGAFFIVPKIV